MCIFLQQLIVLLFSLSFWLFGFSPYWTSLLCNSFPPLLFIHLPLWASPSSFSCSLTFPVDILPSVFVNHHFPSSLELHPLFSHNIFFHLIYYFNHPLPIFLFPYQILSLSILHTCSAWEGMGRPVSRQLRWECMRAQGCNPLWQGQGWETDEVKSHSLKSLSHCPLPSSPL